MEPACSAHLYRQRTQDRLARWVNCRLLARNERRDLVVFLDQYSIDPSARRSERERRAGSPTILREAAEILMANIVSLRVGLIVIARDAD